MFKSWQSKASPATQKWLTIISVVFDYVISLVVFFAGNRRIGSQKPRQQTFSVLDPTISFPYTPANTISATTLYILSAALPAIVILLWCLLLQSGSFTRRALIFNYTLIGLGATFAYTVLITEILKWTVGRPRPDWLGRCQPDLTRIQAALTDTAVAMFDRSICTSTDKGTLDDGQKSFLSGHASYSFAGLTYLALFLSARFKLFIPMGRQRTHAFLFFIAFSPMVIAGYISATRVSDFRHHGSDVLIGATLGVIVALIAYRHWHPWVTDRSAAIPWDVLHRDESEKRTPYDVLPTVHPKDGTTIPATVGSGPIPQIQLAADLTWVAGGKSDEERR